MIPLAPDAWPILAILAALAGASWLIGWSVPAWLLAALCGFTAFFFRDPDRDVPMDRSIAVAPADGRVLRVEPLEHEDFIGGPAIKIAIFLSILDVHINRSPITGVVTHREYRAGKMLPAYRSHASEENERNTIGIEGKDGRVLVHQITGLVARRIVCRVSPGERLVQGQRFGLIKFGSCTELVLPASVEVLVRVGDVVRGGETPMARFSG